MHTVPGSLRDFRPLVSGSYTAPPAFNPLPIFFHRELSAAYRSYTPPPTFGSFPMAPTLHCRGTTSLQGADPRALVGVRHGDTTPRSFSDSPSPML